MASKEDSGFTLTSEASSTSVGRYMYSVFGALFCISATALVFVGCIYIEPYILTRGFKGTTCVISGTNMTSQWESCQCSAQFCSSKYPCVKVDVTYSTDGGVNVTALLRETEYDLRLNPECTFKPRCFRSPMHNYYQVNSYSRRYSLSGQSFPCYYNPSKTSDVIRTKRTKDGDVLHAVVWPSASTGLALLALIVTCATRGCCRSSNED